MTITTNCNTNNNNVLNNNNNNYNGHMFILNQHYLERSIFKIIKLLI